MPAKLTNFLVIHGTLGSPDINWFPWLKRQLEADGHKVSTPQFPTPENQNFAAWRKVAETHLQNFDPHDTILIGHSTGAACALRLTEIAPAPYKAVFAICPFIRDLGVEPYDTLNATFARHVFDWSRIRRNAGKILCFAGDDDPYVPLPFAKQVAEAAHVALVIVAKGGHLNAETNYLEFPLLLDKIRQTVA